jgi:hypothetical protein
VGDKAGGGGGVNPSPPPLPLSPPPLPLSPPPPSSSPTNKGTTAMGHKAGGGGRDGVNPSQPSSSPRGSAVGSGMPQIGIQMIPRGDRKSQLDTISDDHLQSPLSSQRGPVSPPSSPPPLLSISPRPSQGGGGASAPGAGGEGASGKKGKRIITPASTQNSSRSPIPIESKGSTVGDGGGKHLQPQSRRGGGNTLKGSLSSIDNISADQLLSQSTTPPTTNKGESTSTSSSKPSVSITTQTGRKITGNNGAEGGGGKPSPSKSSTIPFFNISDQIEQQGSASSRGSKERGGNDVDDDIAGSTIHGSRGSKPTKKSRATDLRSSLVTSPGSSGKRKHECLPGGRATTLHATAFGVKKPP